MALLPQDPRNRNLLLVALLAIGGAAVYQQLLWSPKNEELNKIAVRLDTLDSLNKSAKAEVAKGSAAKMKAEADAYGRELAVLRHLVPTSNEVPALLDAVSNAAHRAGLVLSDVVPDGIVIGDQYDTYRYKLAVTGPYHEIGTFLANIGSLPRIIAPINLALAPSGRTTGEKKPKAREQFLDARFGIHTYVAHSAPPPKAAKAGAP
jgi:type IV pilus assembly protein PilO